MIIGVGVDMASISEIKKAVDKQSAFLRRGFTAEEQRVAAAKPEHARAPYLATRFAAKEAVFKAVAPHTKTGFDLRIVETLNRGDGSPYVNVSPALQEFLDEAGIKQLHISITDEDDYALAYVIAEG